MLDIGRQPELGRVLVIDHQVTLRSRPELVDQDAASRLWSPVRPHPDFLALEVLRLPDAGIVAHQQAGGWNRRSKIGMAVNGAP